MYYRQICVYFACQFIPLKAIANNKDSCDTAHNELPLLKSALFATYLDIKITNFTIGRNMLQFSIWKIAFVKFGSGKAKCLMLKRS